ncbi:deoxynucleoside triphosphate triphosphohydrolase SAMHD1 isoform X2 [Toxorhynchites rutilus septentrionalis]|uniref:deoxynucleoside triphosphate triphosphohydrolase SAMHD1 isoform X2 n=1 Tax=Toxorhynchites rutilus septentrionalis TaxID=329112 RepID=UPI00247937E9|nr:deoxynucleoside triphosphate triphosphohydrolase SAMHD1 isoform X2 [Toxorhynchites rutilus septentrionalis]
MLKYSDQFQKGAMNNTSSTIIHASSEWTLVDAVHGKVCYPAYVRDIIDTIEFQRLRNLKQLGTGSRVFPGGTHTRFEHCLGVCFLAGKLLKTLEENTGVQISDIHRKCVILAALLHDIGHGPFSHMWEDFVHSGSDSHWTHEQSSCDMALQLFANNNIKLSQEAYEHYYAEQLICALITGNQDALRTLLTPDTMFLAEIVHNKRYKIDVDKWDYLMRDLFHLGAAIQVNTEFLQLFERVRVVRDASGVTHIGYSASDYRRIVALFEARTKLHIECYQHPTILGLEKMLIEALIQAEELGFRLRGSKLSEAHQLPSVYLYLDDSIVNLIEISENAKLKGAQDLLASIRLRRMYKNIHVSCEPCDIEDLHKRFGGHHFFQIRKRIPYASEMAPRDVPLYDVQGNVIDSQEVVDSVMKSLPNRGHFEQYLVYSKTTDEDFVDNVREYLQSTCLPKIVQQQ